MTPGGAMVATPVPIEVELDGRKLSALPVRVGADLVVPIGGGSDPHVGCVVVAQPVEVGLDSEMRSPSISVVAIPPHKEEPIARAVAERLARHFNCVVIATAGVHEDGLSRSGIETYLELGELLADCLIDVLGNSRP